MAEHAHITPTPAEGVTPTTSRRPLAAAIMAAIGVAFVRPASGEVVRIGRPDHAGANPDAELIALCTEVEIHRDRFNASELDSDDSPDWDAYIEAADAISDAKPQTLAGMVAKARAAKSEALLHEGSATNLASRWALDLANDLIRLGGRA